MTFNWLVGIRERLLRSSRTKIQSRKRRSTVRSVLSSLVEQLESRQLLSAGPVLSGIEPTPLIYSGPAIVHLTSTLTIADSTSPTLTGATIAVTNGFQSGTDSLSFVNTTKITGSWNASAGVLTLSGTDTLANYALALHTIQFTNSGTNPTARTISFVVSDGTSSSAAVTRVVDVAPYVISIDRTTIVSNTNNQGTVIFIVTLSSDVLGVDVSDFSVISSGNVGGVVTQVSPITSSGSPNGGYTQYNVTVGEITTNGNLTIKLVDDDSIRDIFGASLGGAGIGNGDYTGSIVSVNSLKPFVESIDRTSPSVAMTTATSVLFTVTFSEAVTGLTASDFQTVLTDGATVANLLKVTDSGDHIHYLITVSGIAGTGKLGLSLVYDGSIRNSANLPLAQQNSPLSFANLGTFVNSTAGIGSMTLGDVNGDGIPDLILANLVGSLGVRLGNGDGTFQAQKTFASGSYQKSVALVDVNGDGKPDLVCANSHESSVSLLLGNGDGTFQSQKSFDTGWQPTSLKSADVNRDGKLDFVVANRYANLSLLLGNGDGTFQSQRTIATFDDPNSVSIGDLNGDGKPDIVVAGLKSVGVILGNGNGTFQDNRTFATTEIQASVVLSDLNGDGKLDLVVGKSEDDRGGVTVLLGNGDGTFQFQQSLVTQTYSGFATVADMNGDNKPDILMTNSFYSTVSIYLGNGNGTFQNEKSFSTTFQYSITSGDVNGDGKPDIVVATEFSATVGLLLANGNFTGQSYVMNPPPPPIAVSIGLTRTSNAISSASTVSFTATFSRAVTGVDPTDFRVVTSGSVGVTLTQVTSVTSSGTPTSGYTKYMVTVSGITGNGTLGLKLVDDDSIRGIYDIVLGGVGLGNGNFSGQFITIDTIAPSVQSINRISTSSAVTNAGSVVFMATFSEAVTGVTASSFQTVLNGVAVANSLVVTDTGDHTRYLINVSGISGLGTLGLNLTDHGRIRDLAGNVLTQSSASTNFSSQTTLVNVNSESLAALGDVNRDGIPDLVMIDRPIGGAKLLLGNGDGSFRSLQVLETPEYLRSVTLGDVNNDGNLDIAITGAGGGATLLLGNGNGAFQSALFYDVSRRGNDLLSSTLGDFNGDGNLDIVASSLIYSTLTVIFGNGNGTFKRPQSFSTAVHPLTESVGDLNGDGKPDLLITYDSLNSISVLLGNGDGTFQLPKSYSTGAGPDSISFKDINGDGRPDLVVANGSSASVSVLLGNGDGTFLPQQTFAAGSSPSSVALSDVNHDGQIDIVVANNTNPVGTVSVLFGNGNGTFQTLHTYATAGFLSSAALADVNGDGAVDIIISSNNATPSIGILLATSFNRFTGQTYTIAAPTVVSITTTTPTITSASSVSFAVTFSRAVTGVDATDFSVVRTGTVGNTTVQATPVATSGNASVGYTAYIVTVGGVTGFGTLGLNLVDNDSIKDASNIPLGGVGTGNSSVSGPTYIMTGGLFILNGNTLVINASSGNDVITINEGANLVLGANGVNFAFSPSQITSIIERASAGNDTTTVNSLNSGTSFTSSSGGGNDIVFVSSAISTPVTLIAGSGNDILTGGSGNDVLQGGSGNCTLFGGLGNDTLIGGTGSNVLNGGGGTDTFVLSPHASSAVPKRDTLTDSSSTNVLSLTRFTTGLTFNLAVGTGIAQLADPTTNYSLDIANNIFKVVSLGAGSNNVTGNSTLGTTIVAGSGNTTITGGTGNDTVVGGAGNDLIIGGGGNDVLLGGSSNNTLIGGLGNDTLVGGTGNNVINSGGGTDVYVLAARTSSMPASKDTLTNSSSTNILSLTKFTNGLTFSLAIGSGTAQLADPLSGYSLDIANNVFKTVALGSGNNIVTGNSLLGTTIVGGAGNNVLIGGAGNDTLVGGSGRDILIGGGGTDLLAGNAGDDLLIGGTLIFSSNSAANLSGLIAVQKEWVSNDSYAIRTASLKGTNGNANANSTYFLNSSTTMKLGTTRNVLLGGLGNDWFWAKPLDLTDLMAGEQLS